MGVIRRASIVNVPYFGAHGLGGLVMGTTPHVSLSDMALVAVREALAVPASRTREGERSRKARQRSEATGELLALDKAIRALDAKVQRAKASGRDAQDAMEERAVKRAERQAMLRASGVLVKS